MKKILENRRMKIALLAVITIFALTLSFFAGAYVDDVEFGAVGDDNAPIGGRDKIENGNSSGVTGDAIVGGFGSNGMPGVPTGNLDRKIIKTVTETVETDSFDLFVSSLVQAVSEQKGRIDSERTSGESFYSKDSLRSSYFVIKIPANNLSAFTAKIKGLGTVSYYSEQENDVTEAYIDVESRIAVLEAKEASLLSMLSTAETVADLLEIDKRLTDVQSDLASLTRQKESYDNRIAYSTVTLTVNEVKHLEVNDPTFGESVKLEFAKSMESLSDSIESLGVLIFGNIIYIVIFAALMAIFVPVLRKLTKNRKEKRKTYDIPPAVSPASEPENSTETAEKDNKA